MSSALEVVGGSRTIRRLLAPNPGMMTGPGTNTYLVGDAEFAVIDPGPDMAAHVDALVDAGKGRIRWILVTHTHPDHAPAATVLAERTGAEKLGYSTRDGFEADRLIGDGSTLEVGGVSLRSIYTPGHASNHLCFIHEEEGVVFSGDHVMDGSTVVISPPDGDMRAYLDSLRSLLDSETSMRSIAPGHGNLITDPRSKLDYYISHRLEREEAIVAALGKLGLASIAEIVAAVYTDVAPALHPIAEHSVWAHLRKLAHDGIARPTVDDERGGTWRLTA